MPTINKLTDHQVKAIKAEDRPKKYADGAGLYLFVPESGVKRWRYSLDRSQLLKMIFMRLTFIKEVFKISDLN